jgi:O-acetyl-ADP-ribose deacetylase
MQTEFLNNRVIIKVGDITKEDADAIVNAANSTLLGGGGVDGAIHAAGGKQILEECRKIRREKYPQGLPISEAVITNGGNLTAKFVIHTVGPVFGIDKENEAQLLGNCYRNSLRLAVENDLQTIAFPSISTGAFGYPKHQAAAVSSEAIMDFLSSDRQIKQVRLVFFSEPDAQKFLKHQTF